MIGSPRGLRLKVNSLILSFDILNPTVSISRSVQFNEKKKYDSAGLKNCQFFYDYMTNFGYFYVLNIL